MKFTINKTIFSKHLNDVQRAISSKTVIPILTGIKIIVSNNMITLIGSDSNISIEKNIFSSDDKNQLIIERQGEIVLPSRFFGEIIKRLADNSVSIELLSENKVEIKSGKSIFNINSVDASLYPIIEHIEINENNTIEISSFLLKKMLSQTIIAASTNEQKPIFTGIHFTIQDGTLTAIATDTHRMSKRTINLPNINKDLSFNCILPAKSLNELSKIISDDETLSLVYSENKVLFITKDMYFYTRLLEGVYPDVSRLLTQEMTSHITLDVKLFLHAVDRVSLLSTESHNDFITLNIENSSALLYSESSEIGYVEESIIFESFKGKNIKISFNPIYMKDALRVFNSQHIIISFLDSNKPFTLQENLENEKEFIQLITPIRTR